MSYSKTFCPLPWVHQATYTDGSTLLCCVAKNDSKENLKIRGFKDSFNSKYWKNVRKEMLAGGKPAGCERCWIEEKSGCRSHRLTELEVWERRYGKEKLLTLMSQTKPDGELLADPVSLDLRIGNTCNLQCVMCRPHDSIKWLKLSENIHADAKVSKLKDDMKYKKSINIKDFEWQEDKKIWEELKNISATLEELIIGGGEPMLLKGHIEFLKHCVDKGYAKNIHLRYHTNLTVLDTSHFDLWKNFKVVEFFASIDGFSDKNHYVRYPAKWADVEKHLDILDEVPYSNIKVMILFSAHFLSFFYLDEFASWIESKNFKKVTHGFNGYLHPGIVMHPEYLSPQVYPAEIKKMITEKIENFEKNSKRPSHKVAGVIQYMNAADQTKHLPAMIEYIKLLDKNRGTDFKRTFPDLHEKLEAYFL